MSDPMSPSKSCHSQQVTGKDSLLKIINLTIRVGKPTLASMAMCKVREGRWAVDFPKLCVFLNRSVISEHIQTYQTLNQS